MSVRVLHDREQDIACWIDPTAEVAFGPIFSDPESLRDEANGILLVDAENVGEAFLEYLRTDLGIGDPRHLHPDTLTTTYNRWRASVSAEERAE